MKVCPLCFRCHEDLEVLCADDGSPLEDRIPGTPEMVSGFRLEYLLSSGLRGDRYRARQNACGSTCVIRLHSTDPETRSKFISEAKLAESLFHPNLAAVYESGELASGECFVVAEVAPERTLREHISANPDLPLLETIAIVRQTAEALHAVHAKGLPHRALRPENILITTDAEGLVSVRLQNFDFGGLIAHSIVSNRFLIDSAIDSLRYYSPEQCEGESAGIAADIYSLGIILYEMLAGAPPFDAATAAGVMEKHRSHRPPDIHIDNFDLRMLITHAVMESLNKRPERRQSSANAFARQLRHVEQLATHVSTPPPAGMVLPAPPAGVGSEIVTKPQRKSVAPPGVPVAVTRKVVPERVEQVPAEPTRAPEPRRVDPPMSVAFEVEAEPAVTTLDSVPDSILPEPVDPPAKLGTTIANFVKERSAPAVSHFARLKTRRKNAHEGTEAGDKEIANADTLRFEPAATNGRVISAEAAAAQMQDALREVTERRAKANPRKVVCRISDDDVPIVMDVGAVDEPVRVSVSEQPFNPPQPLAVPVYLEPLQPPVEASADIVLPVSSAVFNVAELPEHVAEPKPEMFAARAPEAEPVVVKTEHRPSLRPAKVIATPPQEAAPAKVELPEPAALLAEVRDAEQTGVPKLPEQPITAAAPSPRPVVASRPQQATPVIRAPKPAADPLEAGPVIKLKPRGIRVSGLQNEAPVKQKEAPAKAPLPAQDPEEITLVSAVPSRFRINVEPAPARKRTPARRVVPVPSDEAVFLPTILGGTVRSSTAEPAFGGSILANYDPAPARRAIPYRHLAAGSGLLAIIAIFLFANDSIWEYAAIATSGEPASATSAFNRETRPSTATANTALPTSSAPSAGTERRSTSKKTDEVDDGSSALKTGEPATRTSVKPTDPVKKAPEKASEPVTGPAPKAPQFPPIIVGGKTKVIIRPDALKRDTSPKSQPIIVRSSGATRPRVVAPPQ